MNYLLASLGLKCQDYDNAKKYAGSIITSRTAPFSIKEKAKGIIGTDKKRWTE